jgi:O-acetyl-ADP-ribose deacetylase (regulator of RNase III)
MDLFHRKAGVALQLKCRALPIKGKDENDDDIRCHTGECEVTDTIGTNLEQNGCKYVFHTVGPDCRKQKDMKLNSEILKRCYESVLQKMLDYDVKTIAFPCISAGIYAYPK